MRIYGLDFTSAPRQTKPMYLVCCDLIGDTLRVIEFRKIGDWASFDAWLSGDGSWIAGLDFPFGQPRKFITNMQWETDWVSFVQRVDSTTMNSWLATIKNYRDQRPAGDKHHLRVTDHLTGATSPMMVYGVPVGRMFFQGAPRLLMAGVSVIPNHPTSSSKVVLETYPKLIAQWAGVGAYKSDTRAKQNNVHQTARRKIVEAIRSPQLQGTYGVKLELSDRLAQVCIEDPIADSLDSLLCAIQAAWASRQPQYSVPADCDTLEGWIVHPKINDS
jgi:hypothetical protein